MLLAPNTWLNDVIREIVHFRLVLYPNSALNAPVILTSDVYGLYIDPREPAPILHALPSLNLSAWIRGNNPYPQFTSNLGQASVSWPEAEIQDSTRANSKSILFITISPD